MKSVSLEQLQADFAAALLDAEPTRTLVASSNATRVPQWLELYRANLHGVWENALASAFPVARAIVGHEFFGELARAYGRTQPSASGDLNRFGAGFAQFARACEQTRTVPYLGDIAALEWLVHRARYAADAHVFPRERAATMLPEELLASRFSLHPACGWIESRFPVATIWRAHQPGSRVALPDVLDRHEWALIARPDWHVEAVGSSAAEIAALAALRDGAAMDDAIGAALAVDTAFDFARAFLRWLDLGLLVAEAPL